MYWQSILLSKWETKKFDNMIENEGISAFQVMDFAPMDLEYWNFSQSFDKG